MHPHDTIPIGLCECGCGMQTRIAPRSDTALGWIQGYPIRYINGHQLKSALAHRKYTRVPVEERLWARVDRTGACWKWQGRRDKDGYGVLSAPGGRRPLKTHRVAWELTYGPIPDGLLVLHNCPGGDNPACVNPAHLWLGTTPDNVADRVKKGRSARGERNGHYTHPERSPRGERNGQAKLTEAAVRAIRIAAAHGAQFAALGRHYGVTGEMISLVVRRHRWRHIP